MLHVEEETCYKLQQSVKELEAQISQTQLLLDKEKAKYQGAWRQQQVSVKGKGFKVASTSTTIIFLRWWL